MPRTSRKLSATGVYHIIIRGIDKQDIFLCEGDKKKFISLIVETKNKYNYDIYAYCLMDNHIHMVIYDRENVLSKIMQSIQICYVIYFNNKYKRTGHLFQDRFSSKKVEDKGYLLNLCRYIHNNPQKAGICNFDEYKWSSYNEYINQPKIINNKMVLSVFANQIDEAKKQFINFHYIKNETKQEIYDEIEYEIQNKSTDLELYGYICKILEIDNLHEITELNKELRNQKLLELSKLLEIKNVTINQISRVIGMNRGTLQSILSKQNRPKLVVGNKMTK